MQKGSQTDSSGLWRKNIIPLAILLGVSLLVRIFYFSRLPDSPSFETLSLNYQTLFFALDHHFWSYIFHFTFKAPLFLFIWKVLLLIFGSGEFLFSQRVFLWTAFVFDLAALGITFDLFRRLQIRPVLSFILVMALSFYMIPLEIWQEGFHYDQYSYLLIIVFLNGLVRFIRRPLPGTLWFLSAWGFVLGFYSPVFPWVAAAALGIGLLGIDFEGFHSITEKRFWTWGGLRLGIGLLGIVAALGILKLKNQALGIGPVISNGGGRNAMLVTHHALEFKKPLIQDLVRKADVPDWYRWCSERANGAVYGGGYHGEWMSRSRGICFPRVADAALSEGKPWPYNFSELISYLEETGQADILNMVKRDAEIMETRPYLYSGLAPELGPRFVALYGTESLKVAKLALKMYPKLMYDSFWFRHEFFTRYGPFSPLKLSGLIDRQDFLSRLQFEIAWFSKLGYFIFLGSLVVGGILILGSFIFPTRLRLSVPWWRDYFLFTVPYCALIFLYNALSYSENERYFVLGAPFLCIILGMLFEKVLTEGKKRLTS